MSTVYSPGWGTDVALGSGQAHLLELLHEIAARNPRHAWHELPPLRELGWSPSVAHRLIHRVAALGVIAIDVRRGCKGGIRFSFRVRRFLWRSPVRHALSLARMTARRKLRSVADAVRAAVAPVQLAFAHVEPPDPPVYRLVLVDPSPHAGLGECQKCGSIEHVRPGLYGELGQVRAGPICIDHDACAARAADA